MEILRLATRCERNVSREEALSADTALIGLMPAGNKANGMLLV